MTPNEVIELGIYVAGPLYSSGDLVSNTRNAIDAAHALEALEVPGAVLRPFVAHINVLAWELVYPREHVFAQAWDDFWLRKCDAVLRLPGHSVGSDHEEQVARELGLPIFHKLEHLQVWAIARAQQG